MNLFIQIVEENISLMQQIYRFSKENDMLDFYSLVRRIAYSVLGLNTLPTEREFSQLAKLLSRVIRLDHRIVEGRIPTGPITTISCSFLTAFTCYGVFR